MIIFWESPGNAVIEALLIKIYKTNFLKISSLKLSTQNLLPRPINRDVIKMYSLWNGNRNTNR